MSWADGLHVASLARGLWPWDTTLVAERRPCAHGHGARRYRSPRRMMSTSSEVGISPPSTALMSCEKTGDLLGLLGQIPRWREDWLPRADQRPRQRPAAKVRVGRAP